MNVLQLRTQAPTLEELGMAVVAEVVERIRDAYIRARASTYAKQGRRAGQYHPGPWWDGGECRRAGKTVIRKNVWHVAAKWYLEHDLNYEEVIRRTFDTHYPNLPAPNQIYGPAVLDRLRAGEARHFQQIKQGLQSQRQEAQAAHKMNLELGMDALQAWDSVLRNQTLGLSSLFRYCLALSLRRPVAAKFYHQEALFQYLSGRAAYDTFWGDFLPSAFVAEAKRWCEAAGYVE